MKIFIVGAAKSGTTSLYHYLSNHPEISVPVVKEPNYFSNINPDEKSVNAYGKGRGDEGTVWISTKEKYLKLFPRDHKKWCLDASVSYLYSVTAAREIHSFDPDAKIIIVLRDPIGRAWSHYSHLVRDARETEPFIRALAKEEERIKAGYEFSWHYKNMGLYCEQVKRYFDIFKSDNILLLLHDELVSDFDRCIDQIVRFLDVDKITVREAKKSNISGMPKSKSLAYMLAYAGRYKKYVNRVMGPKITHKWINIIRNANLKTEKMVMNEYDRKYLREYFREDILKTQKLINKDLSNWLN